MLVERGGLTHRVAKPSSKPTAKKEREEAETSARLSPRESAGDPSGLRGQRPRSALRRRERLREAMCQAATLNESRYTESRTALARFHVRVGREAVIS